MRGMTRGVAAALGVALVSMAAVASSAAALATPSITASSAVSTVTVGTGFFPQATVSGDADPGTGAVEISVYGPSSPDCLGDPFVTPFDFPGAGNGTYPGNDPTPLPVITTQVGEYKILASKAADSGNEAVGTACNAAGSTVTAVQTHPALVVYPSVNAAHVGDQVHVHAFLTNGYQLSGTLHLAIFGPGSPSCTGTPVSDFPAPVSGDDDYDSVDYTLPAAGTYHVLGTYPGDADNEAETSLCDAASAFTVTPAPPASDGPAATGKRAAAQKKCRKKKTSRARAKCQKKAKKLPA